MHRKITFGLLLSFVMVALSAAGIALTIKAGIGVGSFNSFNTSLAALLNVKVGTIVFLINVLCVFGQLFLQRNDFHWRQWLQIGMSYILGEGINIVYYNVLQSVVIPHYVLNVIMLIVGIMICWVSIAVIIRINLIGFPLEAFCQVVAKRKSTTFGRVRQTIDIISVILSLTMTFAFSLPLVVREGTVLSLFIFSPGIQMVLHYLERKELLSSLHFS